VLAFWDASAILPLCVHQPATSPLSRLLKREGRLTVWWGTPAEVRSTFARLLRHRVVPPDGRRRALSRLAVLQRSWGEILPTARVRSLAEEMPDQYGLRAAGGFQLAAAVIWCRERPRGRPFVCLDQQLTEAAERLGFTVISGAESWRLA
jgi:predicted nucleic acid-binding protein